MQTLGQIRPQLRREAISLNISASFVRRIERSALRINCVPPVCIAVRYVDGHPVTGLASENFSVVNAEDPSDLTHLFCVTAFASLPDAAGVYEIAMEGASWNANKSEGHCCLVQVTRVVGLSHAIELGRAQCCMV
ncbi:hypothetical protein [Burkholderia sp. PAMC 28687]|uniref:hypothetical protein n=1 Tax=Burkholderia sp. PAMC 28687 TaxID=1795874 RepID=UPI000B2758EA|nr:hypothetical protein [Burkholderia sp. PAMC 28687]